MSATLEPSWTSIPWKRSFRALLPGPAVREDSIEGLPERGALRSYRRPVDRNQPEGPEGMTAARTCAVLFADLAGSTRLYEALGDRQAHAIAAGCLAGLRATIHRFDGLVVKTIGDGLMATFATADAAFRCAEAIVAGMRCAAFDGRPLGVHLGFHYGPVIEANGDVFGDTVNVAARLMQLAESQRVFTTGSTAGQLHASLREKLRRVGPVPIRGRRDAVELFELETGYETLVRWADAPLGDEEPGTKQAWLRISCDAGEHVLREDGDELTIGRDSTNDLVVRSPAASRFHARVERRRRGWYLVDCSRNGTRVVSDAGWATKLQREDLRIEGSGTFRVVDVVDVEGALPEEPIRYELSEIESSTPQGE